MREQGHESLARVLLRHSRGSNRESIVIGRPRVLDSRLRGNRHEHQLKKGHENGPWSSYWSRIAVRGKLQPVSSDVASWASANPPVDGEVAGFRVKPGMTKYFRDNDDKRPTFRTFVVATLLVPLLFTIHFSLFTVVLAEEKWNGVDEAVVQKLAKEHGREAREPLINTGQGDLLLFVFLIAGTIGGFAAGYYWRALMEHKKGDREELRDKT